MAAAYRPRATDMGAHLTGLYEQLVRQRRRHRVAVMVGVVVLVVAVAATSPWWAGRSRHTNPAVAAQELADAWQDGDLAAAGPYEGVDDIGSTYRQVVAGLDAGPPRVQVAEVHEDPPGSATATLDVTWDLGPKQPWSYRTAVELDERDGGWKARWDPAVVHPTLSEGVVLSRERIRADRGEILAGDGTALVTSREVVDVGVQPSRVTDVDTIVRGLVAALDIDGRALADRISDASDDAFVPVITLRAADYQAVKDQIHHLPGAVFRSHELPLAPTRQFARALLGRAGPVTAEVLEAHPDRHVAGDIAGLTGLQAAFDARLSGTAGTRVVATGGGADDTVLFEAGPRHGASVTLTLDEKVQRAADAAVEGTGFATALVVQRVSDGHLLAVANSTEAGAFNLALEGQVPPGSVLKIVTASALLQTGMTPATTVQCPATATVEGRAIGNAEDQTLGQIPFRAAFARSCNTAFVRASQQLAPEALARAAPPFGLGVPMDLGVDAFAGDVPPTGGPVELAEASIGQGRNLASPVAMASVAAAVARGRHEPPRLVLDPSPSPPTEPAAPLERVETLRRLMRLVVTEGSAADLADAPGPPVHGKTGTAEYGDETPPRTHAWFAGYQGDLAFAVLVAETPDAFGGQVAAPVAARFLARLHGS